ncbi:MAG: tetratricopeptide repeat protein [Magnetospirillum sp. WYHS-4]
MGIWLNVWYFKLIAIWATLFKMPAVAIDYWERIRALKPRDPDVLAALAHLKAIHGARGEAIALLHQILETAPDQAASWFNLGFLQQEDDRHEDAIASFRRAIALDGKLDRAWYGLALSQIKMGQVEEGVAALKKNTELQPMSPYGWYQLAHAYCRLGQTERAETVIRRLAKFEPQVARLLERETGIKAGVESPH